MIRAPLAWYVPDLCVESLSSHLLLEFAAGEIFWANNVKANKRPIGEFNRGEY